MDALVYTVLSHLSLPELTLISSEDLEGSDPQLLEAKRNRGLLEYYFTCTPSLPLFILKHHPDVLMITYLDADLFFFFDPAPVHEEIRDSSIAIIGHRFPVHLRHLEIHGVYNVGWLSFRRCAEAFLCLQKWREQCINWCVRKPENSRYADQKYLDEWPSLYKDLLVLPHKGANLAPWNLINYEIRWHDGRVWVDDQPLVFYHFHGLHPLRNWFYDSQLDRYETRPSMTVMRRVYLPYIQRLKQETRLIASEMERAGIGQEKGLEEKARARSPMRNVLHLCKGMLTRKYLIAAGNCIL